MFETSEVALFDIASPADITTLWDMVDGPMPRGVLGLGDPDVHVIDATPTMFLGGFSTSFRNRLYTATLTPGADPVRASWRIRRDADGRALPLAPDPPKGAWDTAGMHTPSYVPAVAGQPARVYYTGRASRKHYGPRSSYAIGALEFIDGAWVRREEPLIRGGGRRMSVLEPLVVHDRGRYVMWFQANPHEIGPGELPDYELRVTDSADGLHWSPPRVFATAEEGFFDNAVARTDDGWLMVLARGANLHGTAGMPAQGLWVSTARTLSTDRGDWSPPHHVLRTDEPGAPANIARGVYGPGVLHDTATGRTVGYATGVREAPRWPLFLARRIIRGRRAVVPSPFYLSVAAIELTDRASIGDGGTASAGTELPPVWAWRSARPPVNPQPRHGVGVGVGASPPPGVEVSPSSRPGRGVDSGSVTGGLVGESGRCFFLSCFDSAGSVSIARTTRCAPTNSSNHTGATFTTSPGRGACTIFPSPMYMPTW